MELAGPVIRRMDEIAGIWGISRIGGIGNTAYHYNCLRKHTTIVSGRLMASGGLLRFFASNCTGIIPNPLPLAIDRLIRLRQFSAFAL